MRAGQGSASGTQPALSLPVPPVILLLDTAIPRHSWCIPFSVDGFPVPRIHWLFNGTVLAEGPYIHTLIMEYEHNSTVLHGCLQLNRPTHVNNGNYTLVVHNALGSASRSVQVRFMDNPFSFSPEEPIPGRCQLGAAWAVPPVSQRGCATPAAQDGLCWALPAGCTSPGVPQFPQG